MNKTQISRKRWKTLKKKNPTENIKKKKTTQMENLDLKITINELGGKKKKHKT